jgi:ABC-2 type transport system permease protein
MTASTLETPTPGAPSAAVAGTVTFGSIVRSELTKLRSVRSTYWTLLAALVFMVFIGTLAVNATATPFSHKEGDAEFDPMLLTFVGIQLAQLAIGVLGVLAITSEYGTGMIRTTFTAVPHRTKLLLGKTVAFALVALVAATVMCVLVFFIGQGLYGAEGLHYSLLRFETPLWHGGSPAPGRALVGAILYLVVSGLLGFALGALIRRTPGAIVALVVLQFVAVAIFFAIAAAAGGAWRTLPSWLPTQAGHQVFTVIHTEDGIKSPWGGLAVMVAWAAGILAIAALLLEKRDV